MLIAIVEESAIDFLKICYCCCFVVFSALNYQDKYRNIKQMQADVDVDTMRTLRVNYNDNLQADGI